MLLALCSVCLLDRRETKVYRYFARRMEYVNRRLTSNPHGYAIRRQSRLSILRPPVVIRLRVRLWASRAWTTLGNRPASWISRETIARARTLLHQSTIAMIPIVDTVRNRTADRNITPTFYILFRQRSGSYSYLLSFSAVLWRIGTIEILFDHAASKR